MKRLTMIFHDDVNFDFKALLPLAAEAVDFRVETIEEAKPVRILRKGKSGGTTQSTILNHFTPEGMFAKHHVEKWLTEKGFAKTSASPAISALKKAGHLEEVRPQTYKWLKGV